MIAPDTPTRPGNRSSDSDLSLPGFPSRDCTIEDPAGLALEHTHVDRPANLARPRAGDWGRLAAIQSFYDSSKKLDTYVKITLLFLFIFLEEQQHLESPSLK